MLDPAATHPRRAFTVTELLIVIGVIVILIGLLLPALGNVWKSGEMATSMNDMRQISIWMRQYSSENNEHIVPSQFDYSNDPYPGKVRSTAVATGQENMGTWTDILWTVFEVGGFPTAQATDPDYRFDSPDRELYDRVGQLDDNPFRSGADNTRDMPAGSGPALPKPFGSGAQEAGYAGFFAANNFFNADAGSATFNGWFTTGQIRFPDQAMYLVDSFAGETIEDDCEPFRAEGPSLGNQGSTPSTMEVDFRYNQVCLMLFLDGHADQETEWQSLDELQQPGGRGVRVQNLNERNTPGACP